MTIIQCPPMPVDTETAARLAFNQKHPYIMVGNQLDALLNDLRLSRAILADQVLFASFWPFSVMTVLQFRENLSDCQADTAVRERVDLKYALHLPLEYPGFAPLALCWFRQRLANAPQAKIVFDELINRMNDLIGRNDQSPEDTDQILSILCDTNRLEAIYGTMNNALGSLMASRPEWMRSVALPHWSRHYHPGAGLPSLRRSHATTEEQLKCICRDGQHLLDVIRETGDSNLDYMVEVQFLRHEWQRQFEQQQDGNLKLRPLTCVLCNQYLKMTKESTYAHSAKAKEENAILKQKNA